MPAELELLLPRPVLAEDLAAAYGAHGSSQVQVQGDGARFVLPHPIHQVVLTSSPPSGTPGSLGATGIDDSQWVAWDEWYGPDPDECHEEACWDRAPDSRPTPELLATLTHRWTVRIEHPHTAPGRLMVGANRLAERLGGLLVADGQVQPPLEDPTDGPHTPGQAPAAETLREATPQAPSASPGVPPRPQHVTSSHGPSPAPRRRTRTRHARAGAWLVALVLLAWPWALILWGASRSTDADHPAVTAGSVIFILTLALIVGVVQVVRELGLTSPSRADGTLGTGLGLLVAAMALASWWAVRSGHDSLVPAIAGNATMVVLLCVPLWWITVGRQRWSVARQRLRARRWQRRDPTALVLPVVVVDGVAVPTSRRTLRSFHLLVADPHGLRLSTGGARQELARWPATPPVPVAAWAAVPAPDALPRGSSLLFEQPVLVLGDSRRAVALAVVTLPGFPAVGATAQETDEAVEAIKAAMGAGSA